MKKTLKITGIVFLILLILGTTFTFIFINSIMGINKEVKFDKSKLIANSIEVPVYDVHNEIINNDITRKNVVEISALPSYVPAAFVSIEDKDFYEHKGLNYKRIAKAVYNNLKSGRLKEGASTISQQLIKNTHLTNEKTFKRKIKEMLLTKKLENEFSKKDILETYLNIIYFGEGSYGIEDAAQTFFGVSASNLSISQAATLAGIIKSPYTYSPKYNSEKCLKRRNLVLSEMFKDGKITETQYQDAVAEDLSIIQKNETETYNNLYIKACLKEAGEILNLSEKDIATSGIKIYSYLDDEKQKQLFEILQNDDNYHVNSFGNIADSLSIIINNETGGVEAFAGRSKYDLINFNRQPGSAIKPILVFAPALENGKISINTPILDEKIDFNGYSPNNVGGFHGYVSVNEAIASSLNVPAVKTMQYVGIEECKNFARNAGIEFDKNDTGYALALGGFTKGINLKSLTNSFIPFSNDGNYVEGKFIKKIVSSSGKTLYENKENKTKIMGEDTAYLTTNMLINGAKVGTSMRLRDLPFEVAGKTGTVAIPGTNNNSDAISVAYTTKHTMGVWMGNYSNEKEFVLESKNNGGTYATSVINNMFLNMYQNEKPDNFVVPLNVESVAIDNLAYENEHIIKVADESVPERYIKNMLFSKRYLPQDKSTTFNNLIVENFKVKFDVDKVKISFMPKSYFQYDLIREVNGKEKILCSYENKTDLINYIDYDLKSNTTYKYYIKISNKQNNNFKLSNTITIVVDNLNKKYADMLNKITEKQNDVAKENLSWFFQ